MGLDIKIPIGLMFATLGLLLTIFGLATRGNEMYEMSLNININFWSGLSMLVLGALMLLGALITKKKESKAE